MRELANKALPPINGRGELVETRGAVEAHGATLSAQCRVISFRNRAMIVESEPFPHYRPLTKEYFDRIAYPILGGLTRGKMSDVYSYLCNTAEDLSGQDHLILFGLRDELMAQVDAEVAGSPARSPTRALVWDTRSLSATAYEPATTVWRSPYQAWRPTPEPTRVAFVMQLAGGDEGLYGDIMQSIAPIIMARKPDGVIWWVGDGANGKSTLMDALYRIFPGQLASLTVKSLTDGRDTPMLNGHLANVVKESSEGRIDDTEIYKAIGTHEDFSVHKFHSQDSVTVMGNMHHIFSGNSVPVFNDKGFSARRRTFIVPFNERFESDPSFEDKTFTPEMFGQLIGEMQRFAKQIERQGFRYKWSAKTLGAKVAYDTEANNAEDYAAHMINQGIVAFDTFAPIRMDYENWCIENAVAALGVQNMRRAITSAGFARYNVRVGETWVTRYRLPNITEEDLQPFSMGRPGFYTSLGFRPVDPEEAERAEEAEVQPSIPEGSEW